MTSSLFPKFFLLALISLGLNTVKDIREMKIDERRNWFIFGVVLMMYSLVYTPHRLLMFFVLPVVLSWIFMKAKLATGDVNTLIYLGFGYYFFGLKTLIIFLFFVLVGALVVNLVMRAFKVKRYPFMPVILGGHIAMGLLFLALN